MLKVIMLSVFMLNFNMLKVATLNVIMLSVFMVKVTRLNVIILSVLKLHAIMLNVVAPCYAPFASEIGLCWKGFGQTDSAKLAAFPNKVFYCYEVERGILLLIYW
jgi:hypothetical protein